MMLFDFSEGAEEGKEDEESVEDLLKPGHLTRLLEEELEAEVEALCVGSVGTRLERLLKCPRTHRDACQPSQLQVYRRAVLSLSCQQKLVCCTHS